MKNKTKTWKKGFIGLLVIFVILLVFTACGDGKDGTTDGSGGGDGGHTHSYSAAWSKNAAQHWYECACGDKKDVANHTGDPCTVCSYSTSGSGNGGETITSAQGIELVRVAGGSFQMGQNGNGSTGNVTPVHTVTLTSGFYIGKYEVTQKQWQDVMGSLPSSSSSFGIGDNYPVYYVSWYDALVFCNKLSIAEGLTPAYSINNSTDPTAWGNVPTSNNATWNAAEVVSSSTGYRLPTEAQWEYAAKGGNGSPGNYIYAGSNYVDEVAWCGGNNGSSGTATYGSKQVGTKTANELGLHDMSGNVYEWCWDWYGSYQSEAQTDPQTDPMGASSGSNRVLRGGGWSISAVYVRSANRGNNSPNGRIYYIGFRLVRPGE